jgi:hypothetical protein
MDFESPCLNDDAIKLALNAVAVIRNGRLLPILVGPEVLTKGLEHNAFDLRCRDAGHAASLVVSLLQKRMGNIVAVSRTTLVCVGVMRLPRSSKMRPARIDDFGLAPGR